MDMTKKTGLEYRKRKTKFYSFLMFLTIFNFFFLTETRSQSVLDRVISFEVKNKTLEQAVKKISKEADIEFVYVSAIFSDDKKITGKFDKVTLSDLLTEIFSDEGIIFEEEYDRVILRKEKKAKSETKGDNFQSGNSEQEKNTIRGTVKDSDDNTPLIGVTILEKGTNNGTVTDVNGNFSISVAEGAALLVSYVGFLTEEISTQGRTDIDIILVQDILSLDEVVVVGYGTQKKSDIIGSVVSLKEGELDVKSSSSIESSLQGMASGVSVQTQGGSPGAPTIIKIRGVNSINANTNPLWVIDGMIMDRNPYGIGTSNQSPMSLINQNDIESIEVLKDAAATAIYGSRASSGVIIVTTKKGQAGKGQTSLNYTTGISEITRTPQDVGYADTQEWFTIQDLAHQNILGRDFKTLDHYLRSPNAEVKLSREQAESYNTNWTDEVFRMGSFHDFNISSSKGFEGGNFYISGNYRNEKGIQLHNDFRRFTGTANLNLNPVKNLSISLKVNLANTNNERRNSGTTSIITYALPWFPVKDPTNLNRYYNPYTGSNPAASNDPDNVKNNVVQYRALIGASIEYKMPFLDGLSIRSEFSSDYIQSNIVEWTSRDIQYVGDQVPTSGAREEAITHNSYIFNVYPNFTKTLGLHDINLVVGYEMQVSGSYARQLEGVDLNGNYQELGSPNIMTSMYGGYGGERYLMAYFGRANYKFNNKYLLGFSLRRDGSSSFTEENRWGTFMAVSSGWKISEEPFMAFLGKGNSLKLRGSYGETGNQDIPASLNSPQYNDIIYYGGQTVGGVNGTLRKNIPNNNLMWETTKSADVGIDYGFLQNRINGSVAYYHKYVEDLLLWVPLSWSTGISSGNLDFGRASYDETSNQIMNNIGDMLNNGVELDIHSVNISANSFTWKTSFNISFNNTTIKKLAPHIDNDGKGLAHEGMPTRSRTGYKRAVWFIADWTGVDTETGVPMIYTLDKEHYEATGNTRRLKDEQGNYVLSYATTTNIEDNPFYQDEKSIDPTYYGGVKNSFSYKGLDLSFLVSFSGGNYILDYDRQISTVPNVTRNILSEVYEESWKQPGDDAKYPEIRARGEFLVNGSPMRGFDNADVYHNRELFKGDFIRLRNVQLGYNFDKRLIERFKLSSLRIFVQGSNLLTITDYPGFDPEGAVFVNYSSQIPQTRSFMLGLNTQF